MNLVSFFSCRFSWWPDLCIVSIQTEMQFGFRSRKLNWFLQPLTGIHWIKVVSNKANYTLENKYSIQAMLHFPGSIQLPVIHLFVWNFMRAKNLLTPTAFWYFMLRKHVTGWLTDFLSLKILVLRGNTPLFAKLIRLTWVRSKGRTINHPEEGSGMDFRFSLFFLR